MLFLQSLHDCFEHFCLSKLIKFLVQLSSFPKRYYFFPLFQLKFKLSLFLPNPRATELRKKILMGKKPAYVHHFEDIDPALSVPANEGNSISLNIRYTFWFFSSFLTHKNSQSVLLRSVSLGNVICFLSVILFSVVI